MLDWLHHKIKNLAEEAWHVLRKEWTISIDEWSSRYDEWYQPFFDILNKIWRIGFYLTAGVGLFILSLLCLPLAFFASSPRTFLQTVGSMFLTSAVYFACGIAEVLTIPLLLCKIPYRSYLITQQPKGKGAKAEKKINAMIDKIEESIIRCFEQDAKHLHYFCKRYNPRYYVTGDSNQAYCASPLGQEAIKAFHTPEIQSSLSDETKALIRDNPKKLFFGFVQRQVAKNIESVYFHIAQLAVMIGQGDPEEWCFPHRYRPQHYICFPPHSEGLYSEKYSHFHHWNDYHENNPNKKQQIESLLTQLRKYTTDHADTLFELRFRFIFYGENFFNSSAPRYTYFNRDRLRTLPRAKLEEQAARIKAEDWPWLFGENAIQLPLPHRYYEQDPLGKACIRFQPCPLPPPPPFPTIFSTLNTIRPNAWQQEVERLLLKSKALSRDSFNIVAEYVGYHPGGRSMHHVFFKPASLHPNKVRIKNEDSKAQDTDHDVRPSFNLER